MLKLPCKDHGLRPGVQAYVKRKREGFSLGAHVWALMDYTGEQPSGRHALHKCDNKRCIEGSHLYWGTPQQNMDDKIARGRWKGGGPRHFTDEQVRHIRNSHANGATKSGLAKHYSKSPGVIYQIINRQTYRDVT